MHAFIIFLTSSIFLFLTPLSTNRSPSMENQERAQSTDDEERKQTSTQVRAHALLDQVHSDFAMAMHLQEQERAFTPLTTIESVSDEEESDDPGENNDDDHDYGFFDSLEFDGDMDFLEGQDSNNDDEEYMDEEDEIDLDELSYEELIVLGDFIGREKRGLSLNEISKCLNPCRYRCLDSKTGIDRCVVCQMEYEEGELLAALPCDHPYHSECISEWLEVNKICPICSTEVSSHKVANTL